MKIKRKCWKYANVFIALALACGVLLSPLYANSITAKDTVAPEIRLDTSTSHKVDVTVVDTNSGVKELKINDKKLTGAKAQNTTIILKEDDKDEFFYLQATDYAGNKSDVFIIVNPYYVGETKPMLHTILKSDINRKQEQVYAKNRYIYPIAASETETQKVLYFEINSDKQKDIIAKQQADENGLTLRSFTRYKTYWIKAKNKTETISTVTTTDSYKDVLATLSPKIKYNKGGYKGDLALDYKSLRTSANNMKSNYYTLYEERVYPGLASMDENQIPQTVSANGVVYSLIDLIWEEYHDMDNEQGVTTYTATGTYVYGGSSTSTADYKTLADYHGLVVGLGEKNLIYEMVFDKSVDAMGEPDAKDASSDEGGVTENESTTLSNHVTRDTETKYVKAVDTHKTDSVYTSDMVIWGLMWLAALGMVIILVAFIMLFSKIKKGE